MSLSDEQLVVFGALFIVIGLALAVIVQDSLTGSVTSASYGTGKLYGPGLKRAQANPIALGKAYMNAVSMRSYVGFMEVNKDKAVCAFDSPDGPDPCVYDEKIGKWCCLRYAPLR